MQARIYSLAAICGLIFALAVPSAGAARFYLRLWVADQESATYAQTRCEEQEECLGWTRSCERVAPRRVNCMVGWWYPNFFDAKSEFFCYSTLYWGLNPHWGLLALRGESQGDCEVVPSRE